MTDLGALDDAAVERSLAQDEDLREWVIEALGALAGNAHPEAIAAVTGTLAFELTRSGGPDTHLVLRFADGEVALLDGGDPDLTIRTGVVQLVRMLSGRSRAALLYLADELSLKGDELLALRLDAVLASAGSGGDPVDPAATLDPVDVSRAIKDVSTGHLHDVMGGALREVVLAEVFRRMPDFLDDRKARRVDLAVGFRIDGASGADADRFLVEVRDGALRTTRNPDESSRRDATLLLDGPGFLRLVLGHTNPVRAVMTGKLRLKGDPAKALALNSVMRIPKP